MCVLADSCACLWIHVWCMHMRTKTSAHFVDVTGHCDRYFVHITCLFSDCI